MQTWVQHAEAKQDNLQIVDAADARPGDIVAYDWGHSEDFGSDGHIGFLASNVQDGKFTALEGNNQDQVMKVPRDVNMANVKFIRVGGDAPRGGPAGHAARRRAAADQARGGGGGGVADVARRPPVGAGGANPYPGDDATKAQLAAWMGREAEKRGLPKQLPVMASLVESGVKNLNFGDADSVGFFQMRVGIWNKGEYAGFPDKPELQVKWFLDQAEAVKKQRIAARQVRHRPEPVRRLDRRRRAPRRAVPRPLRAAPRRGQRPARAGRPAPPPAPAAAAAAAPAPGAPAAAAAAAPAASRSPATPASSWPRPAAWRDAKKGGSGLVPGRPAARRARRARSRPRGVGAGHGRRRRRGGARLRLEHARRVRPEVRRRPSSASTRPASTPARRSTSTSRPPASAPATRGARAS